MERGRVIFTLVLIVGIVLVAWFGFIQPARYKASITEIKAEIMEYVPVDKGPCPVTLRKVGTKEVLTKDFSLPFVMNISHFGEQLKGKKLPRIETLRLYKDYRTKCVALDSSEFGEGSIYRIKYGGTSEVKDVLAIELIQSKEEPVKELAASDKRPDLSKWYLLDAEMQKELQHYVSIREGCKVRFFNRFNRSPFDSNGFCTAYYDNTKDSPVLMAMDVKYTGNDGSTIGKEVWIEEDNSWKLYEQKEKNREPRVLVSKDKETGQLRFGIWWRTRLSDGTVLNY